MDEQRSHERQDAMSEQERDNTDTAEEPQDRDDAAQDSSAPEDQQQREETPEEALRRERDELHERLLRVSADYQNYQKRARQQLNESVELAKGDLLKQFIPVLDHFDRALQQEPGSQEAISVQNGLRMVREEFLKTIQQAGVERIEPEPGEPFDPHRHEAMQQQPADGVPPHHVAALYQPGYMHGTRVLRPAKVAVAPEESGGQQGEQEG